jgi:hypothetical protein
VLHTLDLLSEQGISAREIVGIVNNNADNFMTSSNAILRFEAIKYLRSKYYFIKIIPKIK